MRLSYSRPIASRWRTEGKEDGEPGKRTEIAEFLRNPRHGWS